MKKVLYVIAITTAFMAGTTFTGCNTTPSTPEVEAARAKVDSAKMELKAAEQAATAEEWEAFKIESAQKIRMNELTIADYKDRRTTSESKFDALYAEKIDKLEQQNKNMNARIENYEKRHTNWSTFKSEFNHDMDELGIALKDLTSGNKN